MTDSIDSNSIDKSSLDYENNRQTFSEEVGHSQDKLYEKLENRLKEMENNLDIKLIRFSDKNFDGDSYREALKSQVIATVSEPINKKYNLWFTLGTLAFGLGGSIIANNMISAQVATQFKEKLPEMVSAAEENLSDQLMLLLEISETNNNAEWVEERIASRQKDFTKILNDFILRPKVPQQRDYAIKYAGKSGNKELLESLFKIFQKKDLNTKDSPLLIERSLALQSILKYPNQGQYLDKIIAEIQNLSRQEDMAFQAEIIKVLALANTGIDKSEITKLMAKEFEEGSNSKIELHNAASLFFLKNPKQWRQVKKNSRPKQNEKADSKHDETTFRLTYDSLNELIQLKNSAIPSSKSVKEIAYGGKKKNPSLIPGDTDITTVVRKNEEQSASGTEIIQGELYKEISLIGLKAGDIEMYHLIMKSGYYQHDVFCNRVKDLFPDFTIEDGAICPRGSEEHQSERVQRKIQDDLYSKTVSFQWDKDSSQYRDMEKLSIIKLKTGSLDLFAKLMEDSYYNKDTWEKEVKPLFPDVPKQEFSSLGSASTNEANQDALSRWIVKNKSKLKYTGNEWKLN